mgnify:FL=1
MEQFEELLTFLDLFRDTYDCEDDVVIYTGYYPEEIPEQLHALSLYENVFVKFGRYIPNKSHRFDPVLGVELASDNQYAANVFWPFWRNNEYANQHQP